MFDVIDRKEMREKTCCLTGHRAIRPELLTLAMEELEIQIHELVQWKGVRYFGVGGALGFDTLAAELLFSLRETCYPYVKVILVYPFEGYTSRWADEQKAK